MRAELHIVTGKGGVGKSTVAAALCQRLALQGEGPILLIDVQGNGRSLQLLGLDTKAFANTAVPEATNVWGSRILPRESFKQYFHHLLSLGSADSSWAQVTSIFRERLVNLVFENKIVSAFIDVCPGLEPAVLLGKVHWEATHGVCPETNKPWRHVVVDAPSTGHGLMLFKSTHALTQVFGSGLILKQASEIMRDLRNAERSSIYVVTLLEDLPLKESLELATQLQAMELPLKAFVINRSASPVEGSGEVDAKIAPEWQNEIKFEREAAKEKEILLADFKRTNNFSKPLIFLPELASDNPTSTVPTLAQLLAEQGMPL